MPTTTKAPKARSARRVKPSVHQRLLACIEREKDAASSSASSDQPLKLIHLIPAAKERLGMSPHTLRHMIGRGEVRFHRIGRRVYISEAEINRLCGAAHGGPVAA